MSHVLLVVLVCVHCCYTQNVVLQQEHVLPQRLAQRKEAALGVVPGVDACAAYHDYITVVALSLLVL